MIIRSRTTRIASLLFGLYLSVVCLAAASADYRHADYIDNRANNKSLTFAILVPRLDAFWRGNIEYARAAAGDLGISLKIVNFNDNAQHQDTQAREWLNNGIDGLIFSALAEGGENILKLADAKKVPVFLINHGIPSTDFGPRTKYRHWLGQMLSDDSMAGELLIQRLLDIAARKGIKQYHILAINGDLQDISSIERFKGLNDFVRHYPGIQSFKHIHGAQQVQQIASLIREQLKQNPLINVVWCGNDTIANAFKGNG